MKQPLNDCIPRTLLYCAAVVSMAGGWLVAGRGEARAEVVLRYDFADGAVGWQTNTPGASLKPGPGRSRGSQSLEFDYTPTPRVSPAFYTLPERPASQAQALRFWIRCTESTPLQVALGEAGGAGYYCSLHCPPGQWVHAAIPLSDLNLVPSTTDTNNRFDPDQLNSIRFQDLSRYHAPPEQLKARQLWLSELEFVTSRIQTRHETRRFDRGRGITIDTFDAPVLGWEVEAGVSAGTVEVDSQHTVARLAYRRGKGERVPSMLTHIRGARLLPDMKTVRLVARSQREARLQVTFMEYLPEFQSVPYEATVTLPATRDWRPLYIPIDAFHLAAGSRDANSRFDPEKVWMVRIADTLAPETPSDNVLEIDELAVIRGG